MRSYEVTIVHKTPEGRFVAESNHIYAQSDSAAFVEATISYMLAVHAYERISNNAKSFVNEPKRYDLMNNAGYKVDSLLGDKVTNTIKENVRRSIN